MRTYSRRERVVLGIGILIYFAPLQILMTLSFVRGGPAFSWFVILGGWGIVVVFAKIVLTGRSFPFLERSVGGTRGKSGNDSKDAKPAP